MVDISELATSTPEIVSRLDQIVTNSIEWERIPPRIKRITEEFGWYSMLTALDTFLSKNYWPCWIRRAGALRFLGLPEYIGFDGNPIAIAINLPESFDFKNQQMALADELHVLLHQQITFGGSTLFLDTDKMSETQAVTLIPDILSIRRKEIQNISILKIGDLYDVSHLRHTSYGFAVLYAGRIHSRYICLDEVQRVLLRLEEFGEKIRISDSWMGSKPPLVSDCLQRKLLYLEDWGEIIVPRNSSLGSAILWFIALNGTGKGVRIDDIARFFEKKGVESLKINLELIDLVNQGLIVEIEVGLYTMHVDLHNLQLSPINTWNLLSISK